MNMYKVPTFGKEACHIPIKRHKYLKRSDATSEIFNDKALLENAIFYTSNQPLQVNRN